jgi:hypothetical protein
MSLERPGKGEDWVVGGEREPPSLFRQPWGRCKQRRSVSTSMVPTFRDTAAEAHRITPSRELFVPTNVCTDTSRCVRAIDAQRTSFRPVGDVAERSGTSEIAPEHLPAHLELGSS